MKGLTEEERRVLSMIADSTGRCTGTCRAPEEWTGPRLTHESIPILDRLSKRSLFVYKACGGRDKAHGDITPAGRLALVADAAARGLVPMECA